jgi:hypothetical protein
VLRDIPLLRDIPFPEPGDLLVARPTASLEYELTRLPDSESVMRGRCARTITVGLQMAQSLCVDLWLTEDYIHFLRLAANRGLRPAAGTHH